MVYRMGSAVKAEKKNTTLPIGVSERITIMKFRVQVSKSSRVTIISLCIYIQVLKNVKSGSMKTYTTSSGSTLPATSQ